MGLPLPSCAGLGLAAALAAEQAVREDGRVQVEDPEPLVVGHSGELSLTILERPMPGTLIDLRLDASEVRLPENRLGSEDVVDPDARQPRIRARVVAPEQPGTYRVRGRLTYVTCAVRYCRPRTATVVWTVTVQDPATSPNEDESVERPETVRSEPDTPEQTQDPSEPPQTEARPGRGE